MSMTVSQISGQLLDAYKTALTFCMANFNSKASFDYWKTKNPTHLKYLVDLLNGTSGMSNILSLAIDNDNACGEIADAIVAKGLAEKALPHLTIYNTDPGRYYYLACLKEAQTALWYYYTNYTMNGYDSTATILVKYKTIMQTFGLLGANPHSYGLVGFDDMKEPQVNPDFAKKFSGMSGASGCRSCGLGGLPLVLAGISLGKLIGIAAGCAVLAIGITIAISWVTKYFDLQGF